MFTWRQILSSKVKKNSLANLARVLVGLPLSFFFIYFVLKKLSLADYGAWALALSFFSYFSFFDLGMTTAITRFVSFHQAKKENLVINKILNTSLLFYLVTGFFLTFILLCLQSFIMVTFFKTAGSQFRQTSVYTLVILMGFVDFVFSTFLAIVNGFQRMEITSLVDFSKAALFALFGFVFLSLKPDLGSLATAFVTSTVIWAGICVLVCKTSFPKFSLGLGYFDSQLLKKLLKFGFQTQFLSINLFILLNFGKLITGFFLGVEKVAFLDIALKLINQARQLASALISPILPAAAEKTVIFKNKVHDFYRTSFKYVSLFSAFVFGGLFIFSPLVIRLWLGPGFEPAALAIQILSLGHFFNMLTGPGSSVLLAQGQPKLVMIYALADALSNILFSLIGISFWGFYGALVGSSLSLVLLNGFFVYLFPKYFKKTYNP